MNKLRCMFGILMNILNSPRPVSRKVLADKFEISERTVSRYVDAMSSDCDIPLVTSYGNGGGYSLADSYKLEQSFFTTAEYARILACLHAVKKDFNDDVMMTLEEKFHNLSANVNDEKYLLKNDKLVIDSSAWQNPVQYRSAITVLNKAIDEKITLWMRYVDKHDSRSERLFDAYSLVLKEGVWYVYGFCHARQDFRLFKLSRIKDLTITKNRFEVREGSNVYEKLNEEFINRQKVDISIAFDGEALAAVEEWLGVDSVTNRDGCYYASGYVYSEDLLLQKLLTFGSHVRVLSPEYVAEELQVECRRLLLRYEEQQKSDAKAKKKQNS